jgi:hypothetical protein
MPQKKDNRIVEMPKIRKLLSNRARNSIVTKIKLIAMRNEQTISKTKLSTNVSASKTAYFTTTPD